MSDIRGEAVVTSPTHARAGRGGEGGGGVGNAARAARQKKRAAVERGETESVHDQMMTVKKNKWIAAKQPRVKKGGRRESFILVLVRCVETRPPVG